MTGARVGTGIRQGGLGAVLVVLLGLFAGVPAAHAADPFQLSKPGKLSRWAFVERTTVARAQPRRSARAVARLATLTPERTQNLVVALDRVEVQHRLWLRVRLPVLPNGTTGWIPRDHVGTYHEVRTHLIVDTSKRTARLVRTGHTIFRSRVGVGKPRWPTPHGEFFIRNRLRGFQDAIYGRLAFGTNARSAVLTDWPGGGFIGIHGTNQPGLIPGRVSHGCIRMRNSDILRLDHKMPIGTPLTVR